MDLPPSKRPRHDDDPEVNGEEGAGLQLQEEGQSSSSSSSTSAPCTAKESDVGIREFVSDHEGFFGILKKRLVNLVLLHLPPPPHNCAQSASGHGQ